MPRFAAWLVACIPAAIFKRNGKVGIRPSPTEHHYQYSPQITQITQMKNGEGKR